MTFYLAGWEVEENIIKRISYDQLTLVIPTECLIFSFDKAFDGCMCVCAIACVLNLSIRVYMCVCMSARVSVHVCTRV